MSETVDDLVSNAELDAAAEALGWPGNPQARAYALVVLTVAARVRRDSSVPGAQLPQRPEPGSEG